MGQCKGEKFHLGEIKFAIKTIRCKIYYFLDEVLWGLDRRISFVSYMKRFVQLRHCGHLDVEFLPPSDGLNTPRAGWYMALWRLVLLVRYSDTKRLNEHLRTFRINRTCLILSRKICAGMPPPLPLIISFLQCPRKHVRPPSRVSDS